MERFAKNSYLAHFLSPTPKGFLHFQEMDFSSLNIKKFLIFSQKKAFLIFREMKPSYILGNELPLPSPPPPEKKTMPIFQETETLKNFLYFKK